MPKRLLPALFIASLFLSPVVLAEEEGSGALPAPKLNFRMVCGEKPKVVFSWNLVAGANVYQLYTIKGQSFIPKEVNGFETTINLSTNEDFKYTVEAMVKENGNITREGKWSNEIFVRGDSVAKECGLTKGEEREEAKAEKAQTSQAEQAKVQVVERVVEKVATGNQELEQKVQNLESELEKAKQRQNVLEQMVNNLLNFIKNLFRFSF